MLQPGLRCSQKEIVILNCCVLGQVKLGALWKEGYVVWRWDGAENLGFEGQLKNNTEVFFSPLMEWETVELLLGQPPQTPGASIFDFTAQNNANPSPPCPIRHYRVLSPLGCSKIPGEHSSLRNP